MEYREERRRLSRGHSGLDGMPSWHPRGSFCIVRAKETIRDQDASRPHEQSSSQRRCDNMLCDIYTIGCDMHKGFKPYIGAGIGGYFWDSDADADDAFAGNAVVGLNKQINEKISLFAEGKYLYGDSELEGFGANVGVNCSW